MSRSDRQVDVKRLALIHYPDRRLRQPCAPVTEFDGNLAGLAARMLEIMRASKGVGLAASQVGVLKRLFVTSANGDEQDGQAFVNPVFRAREGNVELEEGCLSLPGVNVQVRRARRCRLEAQDLQGQPIEVTGEDLVSRVWQHEVDHLDGVLIIDRMGPSDRVATRGILRALEEGYSDIRK